MRLARWRRGRSKAVFIGVTGSSGKSTTVGLLAHILDGHGTVRGQLFQNAIDSLLRTLRQMPLSLDYVVVETGVGAKGQMNPMAELLAPHVAVITLVGQEHYTAFRSKDAVALEKGGLVAAVRPGGFAVLNADDERVMAMAARTSERVVTFGRSGSAYYRVVATSMAAEGLYVEIAWHSGVLRLQTRFLAEHFWLATAAAAVTALELGVPSKTIIERTATFQGLPNRFQAYCAGNGPRFILDAVKAPHETLRSAFTAFGALDAPRKRIVLGHISDYSGNPNPKYRDAYRSAREVCDQVIFVGSHAHRSKASPEDRASGQFLEFTDPKAAFEYLRASAKDDEIILLKGSNNLHLERLSLAWQHDVQCWEPECGVLDTCLNCGLYGHPRNQHRQVRKARQRARFLHRLRTGLKWAAAGFLPLRRPQARPEP